MIEEYFKDRKKLHQIIFFEILCMFSNKPSFFASKRFERFFMFWICMWMIIGFVMRKWYELTYDQILAIGGFLLGFAAWNATQIRKDQQNEKTVIPGPGN